MTSLLILVIIYYVFSIFIKHRQRKKMRDRHERIKKRMIAQRKAEYLARVITPIEWHD